LWFGPFPSKGSESTSSVITLTDENFEHDTQAATGATTGDWLIEFYAPWCPHCTRLQPVFEKVADELKSVINVAKLDVDVNPLTANRLQIQSLPTIKFFRHGKMYTLSSGKPRSIQSLVEFAQGGYLTEEMEVVPHIPTLKDEIVQMGASLFNTLHEDLLHMLEFKKLVTFVVLAIGFANGLVFGFFFGIFFQKNSPEDKAAKKEKKLTKEKKGKDD